MRSPSVFFFAMEAGDAWGNGESEEGVEEGDKYGSIEVRTY